MRIFGRSGNDRIETSSDRRGLVADAGWGMVSGWSVLAGTLGAYGAFAVLLAGTAAVLASTDIEGELSALNWSELSTGGAVAIAAVTFVAYLFGGYTAGRMARRAGATNGLLVAATGVVLAVGMGAVISAAADAEAIAANLRGVGVPTTGDEWQDAGTVAGIATLAAMVLGSVLGGVAGERWHSRLLRRAMDPNVGAAAEARERAADDLAEAEEREAASAGRLYRATNGRAAAMTRTDEDTTDAPDTTVDRERL